MEDTTPKRFPDILLDEEPRDALAQWFEHSRTHLSLNVQLTEESLNKLLEYAALSYCWGSVSNAGTALKTDGSSLKSHPENIPLVSTSGVIQDVIITARSLSIRYLCIDALYIIQGDSSDWELESVAMGSVNGNAYVTIIALSSSSCHRGFLERSGTLELEFKSSIRREFQGTSSRYQKLHPEVVSTSDVSIGLDTPNYKQYAHEGCMTTLLLNWISKEKDFHQQRL